MLYGIIVILFVFFVIRLFILQIIQGPDFLAQAVENRTSEVNVATQRGTIMDRNDYVLARNVASYNIVITPAEFPADEGDMQQVFRELSEMIGVPVNNGILNDRNRQASSNPVRPISASARSRRSVTPINPIHRLRSFATWMKHSHWPSRVNPPTGRGSVWKSALCGNIPPGN